MPRKKLTLKSASYTKFVVALLVLAVSAIATGQNFEGIIYNAQIGYVGANDQAIPNNSKYEAAVIHWARQ